MSALSIRAVTSKAVRGVAFRVDHGILRPTIISVSMTNRCNSKCPTCSYWQDKTRHNELSMDEWKQILTKIKAWYGPFQFAIGGGEPLIRKDLEDVIQHAVKIGCRPSIVTNGLLLSKNRIAGLIDAGLKEIVLSLNGITAETHDFTRGMPGSFNKIMTAVEELKMVQGDINIGIACVLMGYNMVEAADMVKWVKKTGIDRIKFQALFYETGSKNYKENWYEDTELWSPRSGTYTEHLDHLIELKKTGYPIANPLRQLQHFKSYFQNPEIVVPVSCKIGVHGYFIEANGDVKLCYMFESAGNMKTNSPERIWNSGKARQIRKEIRRCRLNCRLKNCNYVA